MVENLVHRLKFKVQGSKLSQSERGLAGVAAGGDGKCADPAEFAGAQRLAAKDVTGLFEGRVADGDGHGIGAGNDEVGGVIGEAVAAASASALRVKRGIDLRHGWPERLALGHGTVAGDFETARAALGDDGA